MTQRQITNHKSNNLLNDNEFATPTYDEHAALIKKSMMSSLELIKTFIVLKADGETDGIGKSEPKCAGVQFGKKARNIRSVSFCFL